MRRRPLPAAVRYVALALTYVLLWPLFRILEWCGAWPRALKIIMDGVTGRFVPYTPTEHDVVVCSYFKSGTNWMLQIAVQIAHRGRASFEHIHDVVCWADLPLKNRFCVPITDEAPSRHSATGLRVVKTHQRFDAVPYSPAARYICVVRDPKDVFVSSYHFTRDMMLGPLMPSKARWLRAYLSPHALFGSWAAHLDSCYRARERENVLFLTYEEMKADLPATVRRVARHMRVDLSEEELASVVRQSSFGHMKSIEHCFDPVGFTPPWMSGRGVMMRRGERGRSDELLTAAEQRRIDDHFRAELASFRSDFSYDSFSPSHRARRSSSALEESVGGIPLRRD